MNFNPKVSIVIPVYNGEKYMKDAIDSAINQTYKNIEILVINDGSKDNTEKIALSYGDKIKYIKKENGGVASALNLAISKMSGEYFSWLSHDDLYKPTKIEKEIEELAKHQNKEAIVTCNVEQVDSKLKLIKKTAIPEEAKKAIRCFIAFDQKTGFNGCALLINKNLFNKYGLFNEKLRIVQDYDMWIRFLENEEFFFVNDYLVLSRVHRNQVGQTSDKVIDEADKLHSEVIKNIKYEELLNYTNKNIDKCIEYYNDYKKMGYKKSAVETMVLYINYLKKYSGQNKALKVLNREVFKTNLESNTNFFKESNENPEILFHNTVWLVGGVERVLLTLFKNFENKYNISFITTNQESGFELPENINKIIINNKESKNISIIIAIISRLKNIKLFIGNSNLDEFFIPTYKLLKELKIKSIAYNHYNYFLANSEAWLTTVEKIRIPYYKYADKVIWITNASYLEYAKNNNNGICIANPNSFETIEKKTNFENNILCVGRFKEPGKRLDLTLKAFRLILDKIPSAHLTVVGNIDFNTKFNKHKLKNILKELNIPAKQITFEGEQKDLAKYYEKNDILMVTSQSEGFGMVLTEAACYGMPTVCFKISGIDDIIKDDINGIIAKNLDVKELAERTIDYLNDDNKKRDFSKNAIEYVKRFKCEKIMEKWENLFKDLLENNSKEVKLSEEEEKIIKEYEKKLIYKGTILHQFKYYIKNFGIKKTIKKILYKLHIIK